MLGRIAALDADDEIRDRAADRLLALAIAPGARGSTGVAAARAIFDDRRLSTIAKSDASDAVRADAVAESPTNGRLAASAGMQSRLPPPLWPWNASPIPKNCSTWRSTAITRKWRWRRSSGSTATAPADLALLRSIEARAQQKLVARRARAIIQEIEAAEAARIAAEEERRRQEAALVEGVERLRDTVDAPSARPPNA